MTNFVNWKGDGGSFDEGWSRENFALFESTLGEEKWKRVQLNEPSLACYLVSFFTTVKSATEWRES